MQTFISRYLEHTQFYESPTSFWKWSAYCAISAVLRDNCFKRQGDSFLFPSLYCILLAESGVHRKGRPVELCETLVKKINNTTVISGRTSIQSVLDELARTETDRTTGKIRKGGAAIFFGAELSAALVRDQESLGILTDIYDLKTDYKERLRSRDRITIERIVFSLFGASNEILLKSIYTREANEGGLLARTFLIIPNEFRQSNSLLRSKDTSDSLKEVSSFLKLISDLRGEFLPNDSAIAEYESWYHPFRNKQKGKGDRTGISGRIHTGILKISMILAANDLSLEIRKEHMEQAIHECLILLPNYNTFAMSTGGRNSVNDTAAFIIQTLSSSMDGEGKPAPMSRKKLMQKGVLGGLYDAEIFDKAINTLEGAALIACEPIAAGEIAYIITNKVKELIKEGM